MAKVKCALIPNAAKNDVVMYSLRPRPPMDMGSKVTAPIMGKNIKK